MTYLWPVGSALLLGLALGFLVGRRSRRPEGAHEGRSEGWSLPVGPLPLGLLAGATCVVLLGGLALWLRPEESSAQLPASADPATSHPAASRMTPEAGLSPALAERDRYLTANPHDLEARREMALLLVSEQRHMDALGQADRILELEPGDPTALYVQGVVRLTMGQRGRGRELLEQALATDPRHVHSLIALGTVHLQDGNKAEAIAVLERALAAAGGTHPGIEKKLAEARTAP